MLSLALDASTPVGTVALVRDGLMIGERSTAMRGKDEERLMPSVADLLRVADVSVSALDAIACGSGPGSFTSLRIAASIAKGIAIARDLPLFTAPSPLLVVAAASHVLGPGAYFALLDAMRGDVFALAVTRSPHGELSVEGDTLLAPRSEVVTRAAALGKRLVGPDEEDALMPHARGFAELFRQGLAREVDAAGWEPDYGRKAEAQVRWELAHGRALEPS
jgi:tRNA threonylcarbamoyladenosine biosynthesis protein TsaB